LLKMSWWKRVVAVAFLALAALGGGVALWAVMPERAEFDPAPLLAAAGQYQVRILRDEFGVPHIYGKTDADVAYGLSFAHAEDDFATTQNVLLATRGRLASANGLASAPVDYMVQLMGIWERVEDRYQTELTPETRALAEAYAAGFNHYAALHPEQVFPGLIPVTGKDVVAGFAFRFPMFYGFQRQVLALFEEGRSVQAGPRQGQLAREVLPGTDFPLGLIGSNGIAVGPSRSADGATRLVVNSHQPYTGPVAWYEARLKSEEGWDMAGGVFPGSPLILHGHNRNLGWASTVNRPDVIDVYLLEINPENRNQYRFDGEWRDLEVGEVEIRVKVFGRLHWTVRRELLRSVHGPVIRRDHGTYALRYAGMDEIRQLEQYYRLGKARSFDEWLAAMAMQALPSINFVYADREGNVAYFYNATFPRRAEGYDWQAHLPGDTSETLWSEFLPFEALPQVVNPASGFVVNSNHTPFRATTGPDNPDPADFSPTLGIETDMTNRGLRALELFGADPSISHQEFRSYKFDKRYSEESHVARIVAEIMAADLPDDSLLTEARRVLADWDFSADAESTGAALGILTATPVVLAERRGEEPPGAVESFIEAARTLERHHGRVDPPWGQVNRMRRGGLDLPVGGGPDTLRAIQSFELEGDGTYTANSGDCYVMFVEWDSRGRLRSESIHQFGSATLDESSPHYADQVPLFVAERTKRLHLEEAQLRRHLSREYRPGE
jgi:penicillin amidase/acyl-homoserine-lactone acylase